MVVIRRDYLLAQKKRTIVHEGARTGDYLIVAMEKSQHVPFQGRHGFRLTTVCNTNEIFAPLNFFTMEQLATHH